MSKVNGSADAALRYHPNPQEQRVLIQGLRNYFSLPERSPIRNKVAHDVSDFLRHFSPHWTHRAVRLWFNNNKHTYLGLSHSVPHLPFSFVPQLPVQPIAPFRHSYSMLS
jgi:hypothetical protein